MLMMIDDGLPVFSALSFDVSAVRILPGVTSVSYLSFQLLHESLGTVLQIQVLVYHNAFGSITDQTETGLVRKQ